MVKKTSATRFDVYIVYTVHTTRRINELGKLSFTLPITNSGSKNRHADKRGAKEKRSVG